MDDRSTATRAAASARHAGLFHYRPPTAAELRSYDEQGFLGLGSVLTPEGIRRLVDECMTAWTAEKGSYDPKATWLENALLPDVHQMLHRSGGNHATDRDRRVLFLRCADADAVEVYNQRKPRLGRVVLGRSRYPDVAASEQDL